MLHPELVQAGCLLALLVSFTCGFVIVRGSR